MLFLQTQNLCKSFGVDPILSDISIQIQSKDRIGLVGVNGAGKSTLLKILSGKMLPDSGSLQIAKGSIIGYLAQDTGLDSKLTIWEEMLLVFAHFIKKESYLRSLEEKMSNPEIISKENEYRDLLGEYSRQSDDFRESGGYSYEAKIRSILHGLGFSSFNYYEQSIETLSGGQKTRLALAKLLLEEPNLLILDEPTNYLDVATLSWLEGYLKAYSGAIIVVSHDRYFLDSLVTTIYEIERTKASKYIGNYSQFVEQKAANLEILMKNYEKQQTEITNLENFIQKNIARASTTRRAQSRRKALGKMEKIDQPLASLKSASFSFDTDLKSGSHVLTVKDLSMGFSGQALFNNLSFSIKREERVALIGSNGIGKSTLFKLLIGIIEPLQGTIAFGTNVRVGYFSQEQENLSLNKQVIDELWDDYPDLTENEVRNTLGNFLFIGDEVFKKVQDLSGGERARLSLAKLILKKANFLLLDEPTNHLDIFSREVLENSLIDYPGTLLFISHDRYFLNRISTQTLEMSQDGVTGYLGNYDYYLEKKTELEELKADSIILSTEKTSKDKYLAEKERQKLERQLLRKIETIEKEINELESEINQAEQELLNPEVYSNHELAYSINQKLIVTRASLEGLFSKWEEAQKELED